MLETLKKFYSFVFSYKKKFILFLFVMLIASFFSNLTPYISKLLIDTANSLNYSLLLKLIIAYVGIRLFSNLLDNLGYHLGNTVSVPASRDARLKVFRKIQELDYSFHANKSTGKLISIFKRGDRSFFRLFDSIHLQILDVFNSLIITLGFLFTVSPLMPLVLIVTFAINLLVSWQLIKLNVKRRRAFNKSEDKVSGIITDSLLNYETVKFFAKEEKEENRLKEEFKSWWNKFWKFLYSFRYVEITVSILSNIGILGILWLSVERIQAGLITVGDLVMVISFSTTFYFNFFRLVWQLRDIAKNFTDIEKYFSVLDRETKIKELKNPVKLKDIKGKIDFDNIYFSYKDGAQDVLQGMSLHIEPGESVAFVGSSGVGKTTIMNLLLRFYDVDEGKILIDDVDIRKLSKDQIRNIIGIVPQDPILFNNTIKFNLTYGKSSATKKEVDKVAKMANLYDFIHKLPNKYETRVGERGIKLSGGQKQRLAIARMILADPKIIIFDEATSSLDSESESLIQEALWNVAEGRTTLIIAHRFSTITGVDRIIVLKDGEIAEKGTHEELVAKGDLYHHLWKLQTEQ